MAVFEYVAINSAGKKVKGVIDADSSKAARNKLRGKGLFPTSMAESGEKPKSQGWNIQIDFSGGGISIAKLAILTRRIATLVGAGMTLVDSLRAVAEQIEVPSLKTVIAQLADDVTEGSSFANALRKHPKIFPRLYINMISSAESSGTLDLILERLADLYEAQSDLQNKVYSALTYPVLMLVLCVFAVVILLTYVVPKITAIFEGQGATLPLPTQIVVWMSEAMKSYWWLGGLFIILMYFVLQHYKSTEDGKRKLDALKLRVPLLGQLLVKVATIRFSRNLGNMLGAGVDMLSALAIARSITGNLIFEDAVDDAIVGVSEGKSLSVELKKSGVFPTVLIHMINTGENSGRLEPMLLKAAQSYENEVDTFLARLTSTLEPILIIFVAAVVGGIIFSVMLPMLELSSIAAG